MKYAVTLLFFLSLISISAHANEIRDPHKHLFIDSFGDFPEELEAAREAGKKGLVLFFEMDHCPYCKAMKENILNRKHVQAFYNKSFNVISVDTLGSIEVIDFKNNEITQKTFAKNMGALFTPTIAFIDLNGNVVQKKIGAVNSIDQFIQLGQYVLDNKL